MIILKKDVLTDEASVALIRKQELRYERVSRALLIVAVTGIFSPYRVWGILGWLIIFGKLLNWSIRHSTSSSISLDAKSICIKRAPGANLLKLVDFLYSPKSVEETFKPIVADWRTEHFEALSQGRNWKAFWISIRYRYRFIQAMGLNKIFAIIKIFKR